jgi:hypothetical protein
MEKYNVYAEDLDGNRRYLDTAMADNSGNGLFSLYADECGDEEQIVIVLAAGDKTRNADVALGLTGTPQN